MNRKRKIFFFARKRMCACLTLVATRGESRCRGTSCCRTVQACRYTMPSCRSCAHRPLWDASRGTCASRTPQPCHSKCTGCILGVCRSARTAAEAGAAKTRDESGILTYCSLAGTLSVSSQESTLSQNGYGD